MNSIILIGRLTADPELKFINTGVAISKFTIAIDRSYKKGNNKVTDFIPIEVWGKKAEYCATYIEKGCLVAISGSLHIDRYIDSAGQSRNFAKVNADSVVKLNTPNRNGTTANGENVDSGANSTNTANSTDTNTSANSSGETSTENTDSTVENSSFSEVSSSDDDEIPFSSN